MKRAAAVAALFVAAGFAALVLRSCKSDEARLLEAIDDAREALVERRRDEFLAFFSDPLIYKQRKSRKDLERDLDGFIEMQIGRVEVLDRKIHVAGETASIDLVCRVSAGTQELGDVAVVLRAQMRDGDWVVTSFDWK